jgi:hypothetical protein
MKKSKSALALFMSAVMTVTIVSPDLFGNGVAKADSADSTKVEIGASDYSNVEDIKAAVLKGLLGDTEKVADYDFYYDFTFDALQIGDFSPAIMLDDQKITDLYGSGSYITSSVTSLTDEAYALLHDTLVNYVAENASVSLLADYYGTTNEAIAESIFPTGDEGKKKLSDVLEGDYWTTFDGYQSEADTDALAYISFTVEGTEGTQDFNDVLGITLPQIGAGTWNVKVVNTTTGVETPGEVTISKKNATLEVSSVIDIDGFAQYTGEGIEALKQVIQILFRFMLDLKIVRIHQLKILEAMLTKFL